MCTVINRIKLFFLTIVVMCNIFALKETHSFKDDFYPMRIGSGFDSFSKKATSSHSCLVAAQKNKNIVIFNPSATIELEEAQGLETLQKNLGVDVSTQIGGDRFGFSAAAKFTNASKDNTYTTNLIYLYKYAGQAVFKDNSIIYGADALNTTARYYFDKQDGIHFREMCGDSFVDTMDVGSILAIRIELAFNSHMEQQKFKSQMDLNTKFINIGAKIKYAAQAANVHVNFALHAMQLGGDPQNLNDIFGQEESNNVYPFLNCGDIEKDGFNSCNKMISNIISYTQDIKRQLTRADGSLATEKLYYSNPTSLKYTRIGINLGAEDPSSDIVKAMEDLTSNYDKTVYDYNFVSHYVKYLGNYLDVSTKVYLDDASKKLFNKIANVYNTPTYELLNCFRGYITKQCLVIKNRIDDALKQYELSKSQIMEIDYLEHNSYITSLYMIDNDNNIKLDSCVLVPNATFYENTFLINCNNNWLKLYKHFNIVITEGNRLSLQELEYAVCNEKDKDKQCINVKYPDLLMNSHPLYKDKYFKKNISIDINSTIKSNEEISIQKLFENQA